MIFMYLCHALKAGPMKDLASAISGPFALKAGPMKDLAYSMSGLFLYDNVFFHAGNLFELMKV